MEQVKRKDETLYIGSEASLKMPRDIKQGKYDIFIIGKTYTYKIMMGSITFIPDVSMH